MGKIDDLIYEKMNRYPGVLPWNLRNYQGTGRVKLHNDWPPLVRKIPRSYNAMGPRVGEGAPGYLAWPPYLVEGFDVTRWERSGADSILYLPDLKNRHVTYRDVYGRAHRMVEMNPGHRDFMRDGIVEIPIWSPAVVSEEPTGETDKWGVAVMRTIVTPNQYSPSALQKFSMGHGYLKLSPAYTSRWCVISKKEWPWEEMGPDGLMGPDKEDLVAFYRDHNRPDHLDVYYNVDPLKPVPAQVALHWE